MKGANFTLEGSENLERIFREFPENGFKKPFRVGLRKAIQPVKRAMIANIPSELNGLKRAIKGVVYKGDVPEAAVGVFSRGIVYRNRRGVDWNPWQLALWHNYGTLDWRANIFHHFTTPLRRRTRSESMVGIRPKLFIERGWEASKGQAQKILETTVDQEITKFFEKNALK